MTNEYFIKNNNIKLIFSTINKNINQLIFLNIIKYNIFSNFKKWNKENDMKTPCGHIFHTRCLETWLEVINSLSKYLNGILII